MPLPSGDAYTCEGYTITRVRTIGMHRFIGRSALPGRPWLRFLEKIDHPGQWWVSAYKTKREALGECASPPTSPRS